MSAEDVEPERFSVVIPTVDRGDEVVHLVGQVRQLPDAPEEIVVVVDGGDPATLDTLRHVEPPVILVAGPAGGPATARNLGAAAATGDWLVFLDDDDQPGQRWMTELRGLADAGPVAHVSIGFLREWQGRSTPMLPVPLGPAFGDVTANFIAGTFAVRSELFQAAGGFLEGLRCMEFTDLTLRLMNEVRSRALEVSSSDSTAITILVRRPEERASQQAAILEQAWRTVRERNADLLARDSAFSANQSATVGVAWMREGRRRPALGWLWDAFCTDPSWPHCARLGLWVLGPVGTWLRRVR